jgi:uroporphyrinogen decarboxylase
MKRLFASLNPKAPHIHFALGASHMLKLVGSAGADVTSVDWRTPLDEAWKQVGTKKAIQGNLDPALLFGSKDHLVEAARDILKRAANRNGHIFNLGHGIYPGTPVDNVSLLIEVVHKGSRRK